MIWYIIIGIIAYVLYKFITSTNELQKQTVQQGGMLVKYSKLISHFTQIEGSKIINHSITDVTIMGNILGVAYSIFIMQSHHNRLVIRLSMKAPIAPNITSKELTFIDNENQDKIADVIGNEIEIYISSLIPITVLSDLYQSAMYEQNVEQEDEYNYSRSSINDEIYDDYEDDNYYEEDDLTNYDPLEFRLGMIIESENTDDEEKAQMLVLSYLDENADYYSKLYSYGNHNHIKLPSDLEEELYNKIQEQESEYIEDDDLPF